MNFGERLKELRTERGWNQLEIAEKLNVTPSTVSNWERGKKYPDINSISKLADLFDVSLDYLVGRSDRRRSTFIYSGSKRWDEIRAIFEPGMVEYIEFAENMKEEDIDVEELKVVAKVIKELRKIDKK